MSRGNPWLLLCIVVSLLVGVVQYRVTGSPGLALCHFALASFIGITLLALTYRVSSAGYTWVTRRGDDDHADSHQT